MDNVTPDSVATWTTAITDIDLETVQQLLSSHGELLWQPLDKDAFINCDNMIAQLEQLQLLGNDLDNMSAIPFLLLDLDENVASLQGEEHIMQRKRSELLQFLIKHTNPTDLNSHFWGSCHNTTLHLATFLGHTHMMDQLVQQGASMDINNDLGHSSTAIITTKKDTKSPRPKKSAERFKQLDENSSSQDELLRHQTKRQQDIARLAKRSAVKNNPLFKKFEQPSPPSSSNLDTSRKSPRRLNVPEKVDLVRKNSKGISSLKNKSYVTSSVFRQGESPSPPSRSPSPSIPPPSPEPQEPVTNTTSEPEKENQEEEEEEDVAAIEPQTVSAPKETSKEEEMEQQNESSNDKERTCEQSSQHEETKEADEVKDVHSNDNDEKIKQEDLPSPSAAENDGGDTMISIDNNDEDLDDEQPNTPTQANLPRSASSDSLKSAASLQSNYNNELSQSGELVEDQQHPMPSTSHHMTEETVSNDKSTARFSSDSNQLFGAAAAIAQDDPRASMRSEMSDQFFDSYEEWIDTPQGRMSLTPPSRMNTDKRQSSSLSSPLRQSIIAMIPTHEEDIDDEDDTSPQQQSAPPKTSSEFDETSVASRTPPASFSPQQRRSMGTESIDTLPPLSIKGETGVEEEQVPPLPVHENIAAGVRISHQSDYGSIAVQSTSYYVALDKQSQQDKEEASHNEEQQYVEQQQSASETDTIRYAEERVENNTQDQQGTEEYGNIALRTTSNYVTHRLSHHKDENEYEDFTSDYRPPSVKLELPEIKTHPGQSTSAFGKLYIRINSAQDILLPLPKLTSYVRCVVSDGEFEFMSRYELLGQRITFDYECTIDARPDMIITAALHVRPDPHVRPKSGLSKLLTPARKQRETLGGYVHPEDGAIGQTRFALGHMIQACNQKTYQASMDCFNSWYVRSSREQKRQQTMDEDILKVVGSMSMEMLYLPVTDPTLSIPKNLRECDLALRIRQWHNTCWHSGYLSIRVAGSKLWDRHYCRLIGSQLLGYASKTASSWKPRVQYDIADALRLVASSDQVIVTLVDVPDTRVFQSDTIIEETSRGYFRITFPDIHVDCVCDEPYESEAWVKMLKSMIGRVPLKVPFSL
ncbi:hypothetical protein K492DRAFT_234670 [Lichtheimia hyalospora FSU 10163]|nr:hypothetical protein K492DRAFT_234670 [Lichtheimia hyalospora FSU 10163]